MARVIEDVLGAWRRAESVLDRLPTIDPDYSALQACASEMELLYQRLSVQEQTDQALSDSRARIRELSALIDRTEARLAHHR
jgi:hypothetical protein